MENKTICPKCETVMKYIPAGVSKSTGKSYAGFYSCQSCKFTIAGAKINTGYVTKTNTSGKKQFGYNYNWVLSTKLAFDVLRHPMYLELKNQKEIKEVVTFWRDFIYNELNEGKNN